jgi:hypothetical protein
MNVDDECRYELRGRIDAHSWVAIGHPYCEERAARSDAERFTARYPCVRVIDRLSGQVIHEAKQRPIGP